jgi:hypothetical protein
VPATTAAEAAYNSYDTNFTVGSPASYNSFIFFGSGNFIFQNSAFSDDGLGEGHTAISPTVRNIAK